MTIQLALTIPEAATQLRVSVRTVYRLIAAREIRTIDVASRGKPRLRIPESALAAFMKNREEAA